MCRVPMLLLLPRPTLWNTRTRIRHGKNGKKKKVTLQRAANRCMKEAAPGSLSCCFHAKNATWKHVQGSEGEVTVALIWHVMIPIPIMSHAICYPQCQLMSTTSVRSMIWSICQALSPGELLDFLWRWIGEKSHGQHFLPKLTKYFLHPYYLE